MIRWSWAFRQNVNRRRSTLVYWLQAYFPIVLYPGSTGTMATYARPCLSTVQGTDVSCTRFAIEAKLFLSSVMPTGAGGGDDGTKPRVEKGFSREVLRLPPAAALGPGGSLDEFWTRAAQHCGVVEVEIDGKLVYPF